MGRLLNLMNWIDKKKWAYTSNGRTLTCFEIFRDFYWRTNKDANIASMGLTPNGVLSGYPWMTPISGCRYRLNSRTLEH